MKKIIVALGICSLGFVACQKEQVKPSSISSSTFEVKSLKDKNNWVSYDEYLKEYKELHQEKANGQYSKTSCLFKQNDRWYQGVVCGVGTLEVCTATPQCVVTV